MKYMFLIYSPEGAWTPEEWKACVETSMGICHELAAKGQLHSAAPLHPVHSGITVRVRDGQKLVTDGPFAETREQLGGYYIVDVKDLDEAIAIASRLPPAAKGTVEIRPVYPLENLPAELLTLQPEDVERIQKRNLKKFMLICYDNETAWKELGQDELHAAMQRAVLLTHELAADGRFLSASPLYPSTTATCVQVRNGRRLVTDGPFAETTEVLGGYYLILAESHDQALSLAARHPGVELGAVEVRQVFEPAVLNVASDRDIVSSRDLPFRRDVVFNAYQDPALLAQWWGPDGFRNTFEEFDFRAGGHWRFVMHGPNGIDYPNHSVFREVSIDRIVLEHLVAPHFEMTMTLQELPGFQTRLTWTMTFTDKHTRDSIASICGDGNEQNFNRLTNLLRNL